MANDEITDLLQVRIEKARRELPEETQNAIAAVDWKAAILGMRVKRGFTFEQLGDLELETELLLSGLVSPENYPKELEARMKISAREASELVDEMNNSIFKKIREELIKNAERKKIFANKKAVVEPKNEIKHADNPVAGISTTQAAPFKNLLKDMREERAQLREHGIEIIPVRDTYGTATAGGDKKETTSITPALTELPSREVILEKIEKPEVIAKLEEKPKEEVYSVRAPESSQGDSVSNVVHPLIAQKFSDSFQIPMVKTEYSLNNISKTSEDLPPSVKLGLPKNVVETIKPAPSEDQVKVSKSYAVSGDPYRLSPEE